MLLPSLTCDGPDAMHSRHSAPITLILQPTRNEAEALTATSDAYGRACRHVFDVGRAAGTTGNARLHDLCYLEVRRRFTLNANLAVRAIARAASLLKQPGPPTLPTRSVDYDPRILSIDPATLSVSIASVRGRLRPVHARIEDGFWPRDGLFARALLEESDGAFLLLVHPPLPPHSGAIR
jgi:hypothetical protein